MSERWRDGAESETLGPEEAKTQTDAGDEGEDRNFSPLDGHRCCEHVKKFDQMYF